MLRHVLKQDATERTVDAKAASRRMRRERGQRPTDMRRSIDRSRNQDFCSWYVSTPSSTVMSMFSTTMFSGTRTEREAK